MSAPRQLTISQNPGKSIVSYLRLIYRFIGFVGFTIVLILAFQVRRIGIGETLTAGILWRQKWLHIMPRFLGLRVHWSGLENIPDEPVIYVGNHRSYMDPVVAAKHLKGVIVSKSEVAQWPLIGSAAKMTGVLFVRREDKQSRNATLNAMEKLLKEKTSILVFPEGTTTRKPGFLPFRHGAFMLAAELQVPVVPFAIEYEDPDDAWVNDDTFVRHFIQAFRKRYIDIHISVGTPMSDVEGSRLVAKAHTWISHELTSLGKWVQKE